MPCNGKSLGIVKYSLISSLLATHAYGDTEFENTVPLEFVKAIVGSGPAYEVTLYSDIMDEFPEIEIPQGWEVLGSIDRSYGMMAVLATAADESDTREHLAAEFEAVGFSRFEVPGSRDDNLGFVHPDSVSMRNNYDRWCHDDLGYASFGFVEKEPMNTVSISINPHGNAGSCAEQLQQQTSAMSRRQSSASMRRFLPSLLMPQGENRRRGPFFMRGGGSGSSNSEADSRATLNISWEIQEVYEHFKEQLLAQGWQLDTENIGTATATANWTRTAEQDVGLIGTITILQSADDFFDLNFRVVRLGGSSPGGTFLRAN